MSDKARWEWVGDVVDLEPATRVTKVMQVEQTDPTITKLYGPRGEVLATFSDRPPTGFHQGTRR